MTSPPDSNDLPALVVTKAASIPARSAHKPWLVQDLWTHNAVGIIVGPPKTAKTRLVLDLAVSVASATPCLGRFDVAANGPVLLFLAEDSLPLTKVRLEAICEHKSLALDALDLYFIEAPTLWLDLDDDRRRLQQLIGRLRPSMLILDPIERLFRTDENGPRQVSRLLGYLRALQRHFELAIAVVQHCSVDGSSSEHEQSPLVSDALKAWADSMLVISNHQRQLLLHAAHRFATAPDPVPLELMAHDDSLGIQLELSSQPERHACLAIPLSVIAR